MSRIGAFFNFDWDAIGLARAGRGIAVDEDGFDLFTFPSNARLIGFELERMAAAQARRGRRRGWAGVVSHHEQFGALAAALTARELGLPGTAPEAIVAAQHKLHARRVLERVAPEANLAFAELDARYGEPIPEGLDYPAYVKPVKAAFSVLARRVASREQLQAHTRFGRGELWVIRHLVEPFERVRQRLLPEAGTAHRLLLEEPVATETPQYNLDGWVFRGQAHRLGVVDAVMVPGTQAFMRWQLPSRLPLSVQERALDVARRFLAAIGFTHGLFNMEFFHDATTDRITVIEFNPRLASQFSDLYLRVTGWDPHAMTIALALGEDPATTPRAAPVGAVAASFVYRAFPGDRAPPMPDRALQRRFGRRFPDGMLFSFPRGGQARQRDEKWLGSWRYGIIHLQGSDEHELRERCLQASEMLGWRAPYAEFQSAAEPAQRFAAQPIPATRGSS